MPIIEHLDRFIDDQLDAQDNSRWDEPDLPTDLGDY